LFDGFFKFAARRARLLDALLIEFFVFRPSRRFSVLFWPSLSPVFFRLCEGL
jgi:hypothetical protein